MNEAAARPKLRAGRGVDRRLPSWRGSVPPHPNPRGLHTTRIAAARPQGKSPFCGRSRLSGLGARVHSFPDNVEIRSCERSRRLVGCLQQPGLQLRRNLEGFLLLLANRANYVIDQFARVRADAGAYLVLQEILNVSGQNDCHGGKLLSLRPVCKMPFPDKPFVTAQSGNFMASTPDFISTGLQAR